MIDKICSLIVSIGEFGWKLGLRGPSTPSSSSVEDNSKFSLMRSLHEYGFFASCYSFGAEVNSFEPQRPCFSPCGCLGAIAMVSRKRNLSTYIRVLRSRGQSDDRVDEFAFALQRVQLTA